MQKSTALVVVKPTSGGPSARTQELRRQQLAAWEARQAVLAPKARKLPKLPFSRFTMLTIFICPVLFYMTFGYEAPATLAAGAATSFYGNLTEFFAQQINREFLTGAILVLWLALWVYHTFGDDSPRDYTFPTPAPRRSEPFDPIYGDARAAFDWEIDEALQDKPSGFRPIFEE